MNFITGILGSMLLGGFIAVAVSFSTDAASLLNKYVLWGVMSTFLIFIFINVKIGGDLVHKLKLTFILVTMSFIGFGILSHIGNIPMFSKSSEIDAEFSIIFAKHGLNIVMVFLAVAFIADSIDTWRSWHKGVNTHGKVGNHETSVQ